MREFERNLNSDNSKNIGRRVNRNSRHSKKYRDFNNANNYNINNYTSSENNRNSIINNKRVDRKVNKKVNKKSNKSKLKIVVIIFIIVIISMFVVLKVVDNIVFDKNKTINLVINNNNVTLNLKNEIIIEEENIYLSKDDIANFFDEYIYKIPNTEIVVTTHDKKIAELKFNEDEMFLNDSRVEIYGKMFEREEIIYLPISDMEDLYNIEIEHIENTKVLTIDSLDRKQSKAIVSKNLSVKSGVGLMSKTIDKVKKGDIVIVVSTGEKYAKIRTENGKVGYIKKNNLENEFTVREEFVEEKQIEGKINLSWEYFSEFGSAPNMEGRKIEGVNVVSPTFFYLDDDAKLKENVGKSGLEYIKWAKSNDYRIWAMVGNDEAGISVTSEVMNDYKKRKQLINRLVDVAVKYELDGLNIDFENMKEADKDLYSRFIIELLPRLKEFGMTLSVDVTAPDGAANWSLCFDRHVIGKTADYIVFMAYDQNGATSKKAGTTAGYNWVELSLEKFINREEIPTEKIILAVPFYTRVWTTDDSGKVISNPTLSIKNIDEVIPSNAKRKWNEELKQYYVEYEVDGDKKQVWLEELRSLKAKISLINENNLAGVASWVKGMETDEVWSMFKEELDLD